MKKKNVVRGIFVGYFEEDDDELSFVIFVTDADKEHEEFAGPVIYSNSADMYTPEVGDRLCWNMKDKHFSIVNFVFSR